MDSFKHMDLSKGYLNQLQKGGFYWHIAIYAIIHALLAIANAIKEK